MPTGSITSVEVKNVFYPERAWITSRPPVPHGYHHLSRLHFPMQPVFLAVKGFKTIPLHPPKYGSLSWYRLVTLPALVLEWSIILSSHQALLPCISDASGMFGCGALNLSLMSWFQLQWLTAWADTGIEARELVPVVVAAVLWGPHWAERNICFHSDNEVIISFIQSDMPSIIF